MEDSASNSSAFLCIAALGQGPWKDLGFHLFTGFMLSAMWATLLPACARIVRGVVTSPADWFYTILVLPTLFWTTRSRIVGTQTDEPAAVVCLIATVFSSNTSVKKMQETSLKLTVPGSFWPQLCFPWL